jgi:hypothetical protein
VWSVRFGRSFGLVVRQTAKWINEFGQCWLTCLCT